MVDKKNWQHQVHGIILTNQGFIILNQTSTRNKSSNLDSNHPANHLPHTNGSGINLGRESISINYESTIRCRSGVWQLTKPERKKKFDTKLNFAWLMIASSLDSRFASSFRDQCQFLLPNFLVFFSTPNFQPKLFHVRNRCARKKNIIYVNVFFFARPRQTTAPKLGKIRLDKHFLMACGWAIEVTQIVHTWLADNCRWFSNEIIDWKSYIYLVTLMHNTHICKE